VNLLGNNIHTVKKNTETLIDASKELGQEINVEKTTYTRMLLSGHQNVDGNQDIKIANRSFGNVSQFKYLWQIFVDDSNRSKFDSGRN
jgi:orotate phosphoribosyltransferase-like protein